MSWGALGALLGSLGDGLGANASIWGALGGTLAPEKNPNRAQCKHIKKNSRTTPKKGAPGAEGTWVEGGKTCALGVPIRLSDY